ncbi:MAG: Rap1a/Tai family immunity protein [Smithellaceae bacterium]|nr:Rap1a/Tai family immunity protein [Smithellaceae bacterium]
MKKRSGMVLIALLIFCSHPTFAMTGADLVDGMKSYLKSEKNYTKADYLLAGNYLGYVQGVAEATASDYSLPKDITPDKLCHAVANYLEKHPEKMNEPAASIVRAALREVFPVFIIKNR